MLAEKAFGSGSLESKAERLAKRYRETRAGLIRSEAVLNSLGKNRKRSVSIGRLYVWLATIVTSH